MRGISIPSILTHSGACREAYSVPQSTGPPPEISIWASCRSGSISGNSPKIPDKSTIRS